MEALTYLLVIWLLKDLWGFSFIFPSLSGGYYVWQLVVFGWGRSSEN